MSDAISPASLHAPVRAPARARGFLLAVAAYLLLHVALRLALPDSLELDEAEQVFVFQHPALGYGSQPPLYAWLQWLAFSVFGVNLFALAGLKNLLLFLACLAMLRAAKPLLGAGGAVAASASLVLLPTLGWEAQRDLTHSVLMTCIACATLWCYFGLLRRPSGARHALFGALLGLGMLSKYNFAVFAAGLLAASLLVAPHRRVLWNNKMAISAGVALLCLLPHALWLVDNLDLALADTLHKLGRGGRAGIGGGVRGYLGGVTAGLGSLALAILSFLTPLWLVLALACRSRLATARPDWNNPHARFFVLQYGAALAVLMLLVLSGEARTIRTRWLLPLLFSAPLAFFMVFPGLSERAVHARIIGAAAAFALLVLVAVPARVALGGASGTAPRSHHPYPQLSRAIAEKFPGVRTLVADTRLLAGNLRFQRQEVRTWLLDDVVARRPPFPDPMPGELVLVTAGADAAGPLARLLDAWPGARVLHQGSLRLPLRSGGGAGMSYQFAHLSYKKATVAGLVSVRQSRPGESNTLRTQIR